MVGQYQCGHVGKVVGVKLRAFIRVAEIRNALVNVIFQPCPDCN